MQSCDQAILVTDIQILPSKYSKMTVVKLLILNENIGSGEEIRTLDIYLGKITPTFKRIKRDKYFTNQHYFGL